MSSRIQEILAESGALKQQLAADPKFINLLSTMAERLRSALKRGGTIYLCGNGGSACDAMHFCEELVARFKRERDGFRAMHFLDPSTLTCWANDYSFEDVFARQVRTFCTQDDVLVAISTSGNSANILRAAEAARELQCGVIAFSGKDGGQLSKLADLSLVVPSKDTERIQEVHITCIHILCELLESDPQESM